MWAVTCHGLGYHTGKRKVSWTLPGLLHGTEGSYLDTTIHLSLLCWGCSLARHSPGASALMNGITLTPNKSFLPQIDFNMSSVWATRQVTNTEPFQPFQSFVFVSWDQVSLCSLHKPELMMVFLPQMPMSWKYGCESPCLSTHLVWALNKQRTLSKKVNTRRE